MTFVTLPLVTFPICKVYLPTRLNALAPNDPTYPAMGMPENDVINAAPATPNAVFRPKKTFATGFGKFRR